MRCDQKMQRRGLRDRHCCRRQLLARRKGRRQRWSAPAHHMGMLATTINALALQDALEQRGVDVRVQTAIEMNKTRAQDRSRATRHLGKPPCRYLRLRQSPPVLLDRHRSGSACGRDRRGCYPARQERRRRVSIPIPLSTRMPRSTTT